MQMPIRQFKFDNIDDFFAQIFSYGRPKKHVTAEKWCHFE